jgi:hypothetical protein
MCDYRKSENGFIIITLDLSASTSSSPDGGLPGTHFITCVGMKSRLKQRRCLVLRLVHRHTWAASKMRQQSFGSGSQIGSSRYMSTWPRNGRTNLLRLIFKQGMYHVCHLCSLHNIISSSRMASSVSAKIIRDFQRQLFKSCGVRCIVMTAHEDETSKIVTGL